MSTILNKKLTELKRAAGRLQLISFHDALVHFKAFCSAPKLIYQLRSSSCTDHVILPTIDDTLWSCLITISLTSASMTNNGFSLAEQDVLEFVELAQSLRRHSYQMCITINFCKVIYYHLLCSTCKIIFTTHHTQIGSQYTIPCSHLLAIWLRNTAPGIKLLLRRLSYHYWLLR